MNILFVITKNPNCLQFKYDIRYNIFMNFYKHKLENRHNVYYCKEYQHIHSSDFLNKNIEFNFNKHKDLIDCAIFWWGIAYKEQKNNQFKIYKYLSDKNIPSICFEHGWLNNSVYIDKNRFFKDSYFYNTLNDLVTIGYKEAECNKYRNYLISNKISKRPQNERLIIDEKIKNKYIFFPIQKIHDFSISQYSKYGILHFLNILVLFCKRNNIPLVIKYHPHAIQDHPTLNKEVEKLKQVYKDIYVYQGNIYELIKNARFTACLNSGTLVDNFTLGSPVLSCASNIFSNTDALIYDENIERGLNKMLRKDYNINKMQNKQYQIIWWLKNNLLFDNLNVIENTKRIENILGITL